MQILRPARKDEAQILTEIAIESEAYWGYDAEFMQQFKMHYSVTDDFIENNMTYVLELDKMIIGFFGIINEHEEATLEYLYLKPEYIGMGYGKVMWGHLIEVCKREQIKKLVFVTSPQAKEFYIKMGAVVIDEVESLLRKGRMVPKLIYSFK